MARPDKGNKRSEFILQVVGADSQTWLPAENLHVFESECLTDVMMGIFARLSATPFLKMVPGDV